MANSYFGGTNLSKKLREELDARQKTNATSVWFASRTTWAQITSMCSQCSGDSVSYGTVQLSGLKFSGYEPKSGPYADDDTFAGKRPRPVITAVKVVSQGSMGTTKKCSVTLQAFTKEQLDEVVACYCVPQMSVRVEFGWNQDAAGNRNPGPIPLGSLPRTQPDPIVICQINKQRESNPSYDGLQGRVGKWSITYIKELQAWEIVLELYATSTAVLTKSYVDTSRTCDCERCKQDGEKECEKQSTPYLHARLLTLIDYARSNDLEALNEYLTSIKGSGFILEINTPKRNEYGDDGREALEQIWDWTKELISTSPSSRECYITLSTFLKIIETASMTPEKDKQHSMYATFDMSKNSLAAPGASSSNPLVCLIPGLQPYFDNLYLKSALDKKGVNSITNTINNKDVSIDLGKILINVIYLAKISNNMQKGATMQDYLGQVLSGINDAVGNLWELSVVDLGDENCSAQGTVPTLAIVDLSKTRSNSRDPYVFKINPQSAQVRDISLSLKLSDAMMSQALYADTKHDKGEVPCDDERFRSELKQKKNLAAPPPEDKEKVQKSTNCGKCDSPEVKKEEKSVLDQFNLAMDKLFKNINDITLDTAYTKLLLYYNGTDVGKNACKETILPYELGLTVDGIGGLSFGQWITTDALPKEQFNKLDYQITAVEHNVVYGDWTTTIKAYPRYKNTNG